MVTVDKDKRIYMTGDKHREDNTTQYTVVTDNVTNIHVTVDMNTLVTGDG